MQLCFKAWEAPVADACFKTSYELLTLISMSGSEEALVCRACGSKGG